MFNSFYCELKQDFSNTYFDSKIDSIRNVIQPYVYNDPKKFYPNTKFDSSIHYDVTLPGPNGLVVFGLKSFIQQRRSSIDANFQLHNITCWPLGIPETDHTKEIVLYPNPCRNEISIRSIFDIETLEIFNVQGHCIKKLHNPSSTISTGDLGPGVYYIRINRQNGLAFKVE